MRDSYTWRAYLRVDEHSCELCGDCEQDVHFVSRGDDILAVCAKCAALLLRRDGESRYAVLRLLHAIEDKHEGWDDRWTASRGGGWFLFDGARLARLERVDGDWIATVDGEICCDARPLDEAKRAVLNFIACRRLNGNRQQEGTMQHD